MNVATIGVSAKEIPEIFQYSLTFKVDSAVRKNIYMNRIVGKLALKILDEIPSNVAKITITLSNETISLGLYSLTNNYSNIKTLSYACTGSKVFYTNIFNTKGPQDITIRSYTSTDQLVSEKSILQVQFQKNKVTVLSRKLFDKVGTSVSTGFTVIANGLWDSSSNQINF